MRVGLKLNDLQEKGNLRVNYFVVFLSKASLTASSRKGDYPDHVVLQYFYAY